MDRPVAVGSASGIASTLILSLSTSRLSNLLACNCSYSVPFRTGIRGRALVDLFGWIRLWCPAWASHRPGESCPVEVEATGFSRICARATKWAEVST